MNQIRVGKQQLVAESDLPADPVIIGAEAYLSEAYQREEQDKLWGKVWQMACREEEIPKVGDYYTYDLMDQSVIVVRTAPDKIAAYHNVCQHRGRRLTAGCGRTAKFHCRFHGWQWNLEGQNTHVYYPEDWGGALTPENIALRTVKVDTWAGFVFLNFDPDCEPLAKFLDPVPAWLDPFQIDKMRYRWRQWMKVPCNWKVAVEAFNEAYHVDTTHPQLLEYGWAKSWTRAHGKHGVMGVGGEGSRSGGGTTSITASEGQDPRKVAAEYMAHLYETVNANTTETIVNAAKTLVDVLPADTPSEVVMGKMMEIAAQMDAERGVDWPMVEPEHFVASGVDWHIFPNTLILHGITFILGYRARPDGFDPDSCIFEVFVLERYPEGKEPKVQNLHKQEPTPENWPLVLTQDFQNMGEVQAGMKSWGFPGARPNPKQEQPVINFHRVLAEYMGRGGPEPWKG